MTKPNGWTGGPWIAEVVEGNSGGWRAQEQSIVIRIGETLVASYVTSYCEYPESREENAANARLIAAAPSLYEALAAVLPYAEKYLDELDSNIVKARAALSAVGGGV